MTALLAKFGAWIGGFILKYIVDALSSFIKKQVELAKIKNDVKKATQPLVDAKTAEEIDKAIDDAFSKI